jgi:hypothetical protein
MTAQPEIFHCVLQQLYELFTVHLERISVQRKNEMGALDDENIHKQQLALSIGPEGYTDTAKPVIETDREQLVLVHNTTTYFPSKAVVI